MDRNQINADYQAGRKWATGHVLLFGAITLLAGIVLGGIFF